MTIFAPPIEIKKSLKKLTAGWSPANAGVARIGLKPSEKIEIIYRGVEQLVARRAHNPKVVGSSPAPATKKA